MKQKIFRSLFLLAGISVCLSALLFFWLARNYITADSYGSLRREAALLLEVNDDGRLTVERLQRLQLADRVTLLDSGGRVLFDNYTDADSMENHLQRPEVQQALQEGEGLASRSSGTLETDILYYAHLLPDGNILRLARTNEAAFRQGRVFLGYFLLILLATVGGAFLAARSITRRVLQPLEKLDLDRAADSLGVYPELRPVVERFALQQQKLDKEMRRYKSKKRELKTVSNNMNEGMLFLDREWNIVSINRSAVSFYGRSRQELLGKSILELDGSENIRPLLKEIELAGKGHLVINRGPNYYQFNGSGLAGKGFVLLIMDVTERVASEKLRREFSANVSHELKTPLQSVLGYSEIMLGGLVKPEDTKRFLQKIYDEARNLLGLIDDVIKVSRLEELNHEVLEEVSLRKAAVSAMQRLQDKAAQQQVELRLEDNGSGSSILGIASLMEEIFFNLLDNGIKYNHPGGSVTLRLEEAENKLTVSVADTGMGIAAEELPHIFERFYRVDRSRHKAIEGTGLGLSIVKHGVMFHNGSVRVFSTVGRGTEFILKFPRHPSLNLACIQDNGCDL